MKVLKFTEFCNERLFNGAIEREQNDRPRLGDKLPDCYYDENCFQITGMDEWYVFIDVDYHDTLECDLVYSTILHAPEEDRTCGDFATEFNGEVPTYERLDWSESEEDIDDEEREIVTSDEFLDALNKTLGEIPKEFWDSLTRHED